MTDGGVIRLSKIPVPQWVRVTAQKMGDSDTEAAGDWNSHWLKTYYELGGQSAASGSKGCPRKAAYALWFLGRLQSGNRPLLMWTVTQANRELGKNASYALIAAELLSQGAPACAARLWPLVQHRYRQCLAQEPAASEQGEIRLVVALFQCGELRQARE